MAFLYFLMPVIRNLKSKSIIYIVMAIGILGFHLSMMKAQFGNYTLTYIDSYTYYNYLGTRVDCLKNNTEFTQCENQKRCDYFNTLTLSNQKIVASADFKEQLSKNSINLIKAYAINLYSNTEKGSATIFETYNVRNKKYFETMRMVFYGVSKLQNIFLTLLALIVVGLLILNWKKQSQITRFYAFFIIYTITLSGVSSDQGDRFHLVFYPILILLIAKMLKEYNVIPFSEQLQK